MKVVVLLLGLCCFHQTSGVTHSLQYFYTASTEISNFPEFVAVGMLDGIQFYYYDSNSKQAVPKQNWVNEAADPRYWERNTANCLGSQQSFKANIDIVKQRFNQTGGVHTFQKMYGCQWDDESKATDGFNQFGYDGEDFITLDLKNLRCIASTPESLITKNKWDNDRAWLENNRNYFTTECIDWLKKYLQYGSSTLERKVRPEVTLLQKDTAVMCHATGFYPEGVMITLKRDGEEMLDDVDVGETLPNEDGTFQKRAVLTVSPEMKKGQYTCEVAHKSGPPTFKTLIVEDGNILGIIIGCVVAVAVVTGVIVAIVMMKKKGYKKAEQSDSESDHSNGART
ncbi:putative HLA class I histocompatibility antigen, alpha chain H isoform X2 [Alosa sapidissima]|uniref:putative HLA class I histocompatibility antigen, alpha chain H isoform X2 n=1 Tax=Alosa sapidissima TaxID=34773 RepID=UPI001C0A15DF|nr:putative HLA class I histocompatibility antigen, alpha chain H isoform X2 [Alosa sapidissima]